MSRLYAIRDAKVGLCNAPCMFDNDATAMRAFGDMVLNDKQSLIALHPEDFVLLYLGEFNRENGMITQDSAGYRVLCSASDYIKE